MAAADDAGDLQHPLLKSYNEPPSLHPWRGQPHVPCASRTHPKTAATSSTAEEPVDLGWNFARRIWHILVGIKAAPALLLIILAVLEAIIISRIGTISSAFYKVFVDGQQSKVLHLMLWSGGCYVATALFFTVKTSLQDYFAWRWRARLTLHMQQLYCSNLAFYSLKDIDNPDQRLAQDLPLLMSSLTETLGILAAAPFNVVWYTLLTYQVFGSWLPVAAAYVFFAVGMLIQRLVMMPVAAMVYQQEAAEGTYRYKQMRFRVWAEEIALYRSAPLEQQHLELQLSRVLVCQGRLLLRRAVLTAATKFLEYLGLVVNFGCLAFVVFTGTWDIEKTTPGGLAAKISMASFYLLTLIYSFTQVLDLASKVSNLAGLTARVSQLLEHLQELQMASGQQREQQQQQQRCAKRQPPKQQTSFRQRFGKQSGCVENCSDDQVADYPLDSQQPRQQQQQQQLLLVGDGSAPSHKRYASQAVTLLPPELIIVNTVADLVDTSEQQQQQPAVLLADSPPPAAQAPHAEAATFTQQQQQQQPLVPQVMQVSVHSLSADLLMHEVRRAFPESPRLAPVTAVVTMQFCGTARQRMLQQWQQQQQQEVDRVCTSEGLSLMHRVPSKQQEQQLFPGCAASASLPNNGLSAGAAAAGSRYWSAAAAAASSQPQQQQVHVTPSSAAAGAEAEAEAATTDSCPCGGGAAAAAAAEGSGCSCWCSSSEMEAMLELFLAWQAKVCRILTARGYWADALDPRTGRAMHGAPGTAYDEVIGAQVLLGYDTQHTAGSFPLVRHPVAGAQVYPATLFTSAPLPAVREALRAAAAAAAPVSAAGHVALTADAGGAAGQSLPLAGSSSGGSSSSSIQLQSAALYAADTSSSSSNSRVGSTTVRHAGPAAAVTAGLHKQKLRMYDGAELLSCAGLSVRTPSGVPIVRGLTLSMAAAAAAGTAGIAGTAAAKCACVASLLIRGPSGCGKSTLLKCFAGLWPADKGTLSMPAAAAAVAAWAGNVCVDAPSSTAGGGVMFVPQKMLAAPGQTLRAQLAYPAAEAVFTCCSGCCCQTGSGEPRTSSNTSLGRMQPRYGGDQVDYVISMPVSMPLSKQQRLRRQQQQRQCKQTLPLQAALWWEDWLSCGIRRRTRQQQQQQQQHCQWRTQQLQEPGQSTAQDICSKTQQAAAPTASASAAGVTSPTAHLCNACQTLHAVLQQVGLEYMLNTLPAAFDTAADDWGAVLSPGEMQRLGFARVLLHRPVLALLDEATSALPADVAVDLYRQLQRAGVSYVSIGHSNSLLAMHEQVLTIQGGGTGCWELRQGHSAGS